MSMPGTCAHVHEVTSYVSDASIIAILLLLNITCLALPCVPNQQSYLLSHQYVITITDALTLGSQHLPCRPCAMQSQLRVI